MLARRLRSLSEPELLSLSSSEAFGLTVERHLQRCAGSSWRVGIVKISDLHVDMDVAAVP